MLEYFYKDLRVHMHLLRMGDDLCIAIFGGDKPHIGSIAIAEPRASLTGDGSRSATVSTFNFVGHKDSIVADPVAREIAAQSGCRAVVLCGLHYNSISDDLLDEVNSLTQRMVLDALSDRGSA